MAPDQRHRSSRCRTPGPSLADQADARFLRASGRARMREFLVTGGPGRMNAAISLFLCPLLLFVVLVQLKMIRQESSDGV
jgi:hypothetical protein